MTMIRSFFMRALSPAVCFCAIVALGGCVATMNGEQVIFDPAMRAQEGAPAVSVTRLSRDDWPVTQVSVPAGNVAHQPTYAADFSVETLSPRRAGAYPSIDTVIQTGRDDGSAQLEGLAGFPHVGFLVLKTPFEMIGGRWPWSIVSSGPEYERTRRRQEDQ